MKKKLELSEQCSLHGCIERLQTLVDGLKAGAFSVEHGDQTIVLRPGGTVDFELRVVQNDKDKYELLKLELGWQPTAPQRSKTRTDTAREEATHVDPVAISEATAAQLTEPSAAQSVSDGPPTAAHAAREHDEIEADWELDDGVATQRRPTAGGSTDSPDARAPLQNEPNASAAGEPELVAPPFARAPRVNA
jgi:amphi-Trp domain-containing protein